MKNYMKKIIVGILTFVFLFTGIQSVFASGPFNGQSGDCNPAIGIGVYPTNIPRDSYGCWSATQISAQPGDTINVAMYYHNNTNAPLSNVRGSIVKSSSGPSKNFTFTGSMYSDQGSQTIGTVSLNLPSSQTLTYSSTHWMKDAAAVKSDTDTNVFINDGGQISIGSVPAGWNDYGEFLVVYKVSNNVAPQLCNDPAASNYQGALPCTYPAQLCQDPAATNYHGSLPCTYPAQLCKDPTATNYNGSLPCVYPVVKQCVISNFTANPTSITSGNASTLSWNTTDCTSVTISNLGYGVPVSGSQAIYPTSTTNYLLTAYGANGQPQTRQATVTVNQVVNNCAISNFTANPTSITSGNASTLTWNTTDCTNVTISNLGYSVPVSGSQAVYPTVTTTYVLTASGANGQAQTMSATVYVNQIVNNCLISNFTATPYSITENNSSTLNWNTNNCTNVVISNLGYSVPVSGSQVVYPTVTTTYVLTANGINGNTQTMSATVYVTQVQNNLCRDYSANNYGYSLPCTYPQVQQYCQDYAASNYLGTLPCRYPVVQQYCQDYSATNYQGVLPCRYPVVQQYCQDYGATNYQGVLPCRYAAVIQNQICRDTTANNYLGTLPCNYYNNYNNTPTVYYNKSVVTTVATNITRSEAQINGYITNSSYVNSSVYFNYGTSVNLGSRTASKSTNGNTNFSERISGLSPNTIYFFQAVGEGSDGVAKGSIEIFRTLADATVKPIIVQGTTIIGTASPVRLTISNRYQLIGAGDLIDYVVTYKNIGKYKLIRPMVQVVLPTNVTLINSSRGTYSVDTHTLSAPIEDLEAGQEGIINLQARVDSIPLNNSQIVTTAILVYTNPNGAQENAMTYVINVPKIIGGVSGTTVVDNGSVLGGAAFFGGLFSIGILGWLLILLLIMLIILASRSFNNRRVPNDMTVHNQSPRY
jgi:hypothetical protein